MKVLITAGPTQEFIDPLRYISNSSSGKQGYALADYMSNLGYEVTLISGPVKIKCDDFLFSIFHVRSASEMLERCVSALPVDVAIFTAAVTDWLPQYSDTKIKKSEVEDSFYDIKLSYNIDILKYVSTHNIFRPKLVIGFALESHNILENARKKLLSKKCDWIIANYVKVNNVDTMGNDYNQITLITKDQCQFLPIMTKKEIAVYLTNKIRDHFSIH